ncbi:MAG: cation-transporting P-type ATPase [Nanoarchaeota archaeon]|nr:cation-transporting P-type ATPase [Nanoarchaeota archaeon]
MKKEEGLKETEAKKLLEKYGRNELEDIGKVSSVKIIWRQVKGNFVIYLLLVAMILSFFVGKIFTAWAILGVVFAVVAAGFIQEFKAEKAINALKNMLMPITTVVRDGKEKEIPSSELVPGDLILLRNGEKVPAECILVSQTDLSLDESVLTGESKEVKKSVPKNEKNISDENKLFMGSFLVSGKCTAVVLNTGMKTQFGKIAGMISTAEKELPLQKKINQIAKIMAFVAILIAVLTGTVALLQEPLTEEYLIEIFILVIAISVAAFPVGLPLVLITTLSGGAYKMAKKNAIVNRMSAIEALGETTVVCADKTGTITKGEMTVRKVITPRREYSITGVGYKSKGDFMLDEKKIDPKKHNELNLILKTCTLCNDSKISKIQGGSEYKPNGNPTEGALLIMSAKAGIFKEDFSAESEKEIPFSSERKQMTIVVKEGGKKAVYSKGALEVVLEKCSHIIKEGEIFRMLERDRKAILSENSKLTSNSFRTLGVAFKESGFDKPEEGLVFLGIVAMEDPPRDEVKDALLLCKKAGIKVKMITGDDIQTAIAIAKQIGLQVGQTLEGHELDEMKDQTLKKIIDEITIFARVRPEHKIRIVRMLKEKGEVVTMTGDGVNDAPALKEAHVGVAMGIKGTDVSRSVADLTLKDDNFATIVDAIKEGRTTFNNMKKFVSFQLSCNYAELAILFLGVLLVPFLGWPIPLLLALQILLMNLVTDNLPAITLGFNPSSRDIMEEKPMKKKELLNKNLLTLIAFNGLLMCILTLLVFFILYNVLRGDAEYARTTALATLILLEIASAFNFRSFRKGTLTRSIFTNKPLAYASIISIAVTLAVIYTPLNIIFETTPITLLDWGITIGATFIIIFVFDILKRINEKRKFMEF